MKSNFHRGLLWVCHDSTLVSPFQGSLLQLHMHNFSNFVSWDFFTAELQLCMVDPLQSFAVMQSLFYWM